MGFGSQQESKSTRMGRMLCLEARARKASATLSGGGKRLGNLARQAIMQRRKRALENAHAPGAIEIGLRAAPRKMQDAVELALHQRRRDNRRKAFDLDGAVDHHRPDGHAGKREVAGTILAADEVFQTLEKG